LQCVCYSVAGNKRECLVEERARERHTATHCNTLQHTATHCNTLQHTATHCNTLQHTATHCNTLQHTAAHCNTFYHAATRCNTLHHIAKQLLSVKSKPVVALPARHCVAGVLQCVCYSVAGHQKKLIVLVRFWTGSLLRFSGIRRSPLGKHEG